MKLLQDKDYIFFTSHESLCLYIFSRAEDLNKSNRHYGLDTEFERDT